MSKAMAPIKIEGMLRRHLIQDLGIALGLGFAMGNLYWYGFHMPRTHKRDNFYAKLEEQQAAEQKALNGS